MKRTTLLKLKSFSFTVLSLAICWACSKNEDEPTPDAQIAGTWELTAFTYDGYFEGIDEFIPVTGTAKNINNVLVTFNNDGTVNSNGTSFTWVITSKADETESLEFPVTMFEEGGDWEKAGDILTVDDFIESGDSMDLTIAELTSSRLHLTGSFEVTPGSGMMYSYDVRMTRKE